ncbi:hypothetical protein MPDQ_006968 [Monascus purpureus]|uniref:Uncharacterized protein n=1 Tax=Monascus purpureus TaxID=5098 RepID=A0A507QXJ0_MONPU|nr:hypothetical protein MPDQ_006968 [Monascus purpureus]
MDELDDVFDDHPSLDVSLEDFERAESPQSHHASPPLEIPSQHSGFREDASDNGTDITEEEGPQPRWSPPGFRHDYVNGSSWYRHQPYMKGEPGRMELVPAGTFSANQSREVTPQFEDAAETPAVKNIRFVFRAEFQHCEPFTAFLNYLRRNIDRATSSKSNALMSVFVGMICIAFMRALFLPGTPPGIPDLVKLSSFARSFEPLIYYSENGVQQIGTLQETGVAVWDLSESLRGSNMTSAPIIVGQLDELSESLKSLSLELTRFFADVDADIDSILIVMDWAKRELETLSSQPPNSLPSIAYDNFHLMLSRLGALERASGSQDTGGGELMTVPTTFGNIVTAIFGPTSSQRMRSALTRTFTEFLSVLEESINSELTHSTALFALFESIDRQFLNLQRTVVRESDAQERAEGEMLSSLWTRVLGPDAAMVRKYEKNRRLLASVRSRTVANKHLLMDHRSRLLTLKVNLETLRRKLVSPLVRRNDSVTFGGAIEPSNSRRGNRGGLLGPVESVIEGQIRGLAGSQEYLRSVREKQKAKLMELVYGSGRKLPSQAIVSEEPEGDELIGVH